MDSFFSLEKSKKARVPGLGLGIFAFLLLWFSFQLEMTNTAPRQLVPPPPFVEHMTIGYREVVADALWIRAIQDLDYCDNKIGENLCKGESWLFKMLDSITNLSPSFRIAYAAGALALTVIISDIEGATKIFDKGVHAFPNDWPILYSASYHYLYEVKDKKRAAELLIQAGKNGAPPFVFALAGRLYSDAGYMDLAESLLQKMIAEKQDPFIIKRLEGKIAAMKAPAATKKNTK